MDSIDVHASAERWSELRRRAISGTILAIVFLAAVLAGGMFFTALVLLAALQMIREWDNLTRDETAAWQWAGLAYVGIPCLCLFWLRGLGTEAYPFIGLGLTLYLVGTIAATDIGAYFAGRRIGGPKLAPSISPSKTWAGLGGGMLAAGLAGILASFFLAFQSAFTALLMSLLLAFVSQGGDLFESWLKRRAGVKDSGVLIPGHGGLLDRVDGLVAAAPLLTLIVLLQGLPA